MVREGAAEMRRDGVSMLVRRVEISRGRVQHGNEREDRHSSGLIQRPLCETPLPATMHGWAIVTETPPSITAMVDKEGAEKEPSLTPN